MSRIGKKPILIPQGVQITLTENQIKVSGTKGKLERKINPQVQVVQEGDHLLVQKKEESRQARELYGLTRTLVANMVEGVSRGFQKILDIQGIGYRSELKGQDLVLNLGYSHPVQFALPQGITAQVEKQTRIILSGMDKELLGLTAAKLRKCRPPEPYKGKGIRMAGEYVRKKAGKAGAK
jgi:large subunit ribosomal protein L6